MTCADLHGWSEGGTVEAGCCGRGTRGVCPHPSGWRWVVAMDRTAAAAELGGVPGRMFACLVIDGLAIGHLDIF